MELITNRVDLTGASKDERAEVCFKAVKVLDTAIGQISLMYREVGRLLEYIHKEKLYKDYSSDVKTWSQFIRSVNLGFGVSQADHLRRISRTFEPYLDGRNVKFTRLLDILPVATKENIPDLLDAAEQLPASGWNDAVRELKGQVTTDECEHDECSLFKKCKKCGMWLKS